MHYYLWRTRERYKLTDKDIFAAVYGSQWLFHLRGYRLSFNLPQEVQYFCAWLLEKPQTK